QPAAYRPHPAPKLLQPACQNRATPLAQLLHQSSPQDPAAQAATFVDDVVSGHPARPATRRYNVADFGYGGIGSGLDISGMVSQLVAADRKPADNALNLQQSKAKLQLSAIGTVKSAFDT